MQIFKRNIFHERPSHPYSPHIPRKHTLYIIYAIFMHFYRIYIANSHSRYVIMLIFNLLSWHFATTSTIFRKYFKVFSQNICHYENCIYICIVNEDKKRSKTLKHYDYGTRINYFRHSNNFSCSQNLHGACGLSDKSQTNQLLTLKHYDYGNRFHYFSNNSSNNSDKNLYGVKITKEDVSHGSDRQSKLKASIFVTNIEAFLFPIFPSHSKSDPLTKPWFFFQLSKSSYSLSYSTCKDGKPSYDTSSRSYPNCRQA